MKDQTDGRKLKGLVLPEADQLCLLDIMLLIT